MTIKDLKEIVNQVPLDLIENPVQIITAQEVPAPKPHYEYNEQTAEAVDLYPDGLVIRSY